MKNIVEMILGKSVSDKNREVTSTGRNILRWRTMDVGRKGHDYLKVAVVSGKGPKGGTTLAKLVAKKDIKKKVKF